MKISTSAGEEKRQVAVLQKNYSVGGNRQVAARNGNAMFDYQQSGRYFAQAAEGFEEIAALELAGLGARDVVPAYRGFHFSADPSTLYAINYKARLLTRVLAPLATFQCRNREDLYRAGRTIDWGALLSVEHTFGITANVSGNTGLRHSQFAAMCLKDAIADDFRSRVGARPSVDRAAPDIWFNLHIQVNRATISLDASGGSLHRRGYRRQSVAAPMQETLAAAMVALSGWQGDRPLIDPMCGSGTLLCEALMAYCRIPAGYLRQRFGCRRLPDFDDGLWRQMKAAADAAIRPMPAGLIAGSDIDSAAVKAAAENCRQLPGGEGIRLSRRDCLSLGGLPDHVILSNPPYGVRLGKNEDLGWFYRQLGDFLKRRCSGASAYLFFGDRGMIKRIGLKPAWKKALKNAALDGRVARFDLFKGYLKPDRGPSTDPSQKIPRSLKA